MMFYSHLVLGIAFALPLLNANPLSLSAVFLGSLLPDIDTPRSYLGRRLPGISALFSSILRHRGITHSLLAWALLTLLSIFLCSRLGAGFIIAESFSLAYLSHIAGDFLTSEGVPIFLPLKARRFSLGLFSTGSAGEMLFSACVCVLLLVTRLPDLT